MHDIVYTPLYISSIQYSFHFLPNPFSSAFSDIVLAVEGFWYAAQVAGHVTSEIGTEGVLDTLLKGFCIGKWECVGQWSVKGWTVERAQMAAKTKVDGRGCSTELEREWDSRKAVTKLKYDVY